MMKRLLLYLLAGAILLAVAITADRGYKDTALLQQYAAEISAYLAGQESEAQAWVLQQQPALRARAAGQPVAHPADWINTLTGQAVKPYTVLIHAGDSILFASNNKALPQREQLAEIAKAGERAVLQLSLGYYYARRQNFGPAQTLTLQVPIRFT